MTLGDAENEVLATVYGYAGLYAWYRSDKVGSIAFVIFNTETKKSRTVGVSPSSTLGNTRGFALMFIAIAVRRH